MHDLIGLDSTDFQCIHSQSDSVILMVLGSRMEISWRKDCGLVRVAVKNSKGSVMSSWTTGMLTHCGSPPATLRMGKTIMVPAGRGVKSDISAQIKENKKLHSRLIT